MVTVKKAVLREFSLESVTPDAPQVDFDHFDLRESAVSPIPDLVKDQLPWSYPGPPGPQEQYESEFQVSPPNWWLTIPQPKPDNRTIPTTLDQYQMRLKLLHQHGTIDRKLLKPTQEQKSMQWTPIPEWTEFMAVDYQTQLKLLEEQNKTRLSMARAQLPGSPPISGKGWIPPLGWRESLPPEYLDALKYLEEQDKTRLRMKKEENKTSTVPPPKVYPGVPMRVMSDASIKGEMLSLPISPPLPFAVAGHNQMQLKLLEQQNKQRLTMARQEPSVMMGQNQLQRPDAGPANREQSVESTSTWSAQFTPESTPGFQEAREPTIGALHANQLDVTESNAHLGQTFQKPAYNCAYSGQILGDHDTQIAMLKQQSQVSIRKIKEEEIDTATSSIAATWNLQQDQKSAFKDQRERAKMETRQVQEEEVLSGSRTLQDRQMQLMLLEQQNSRSRMKVGYKEEQIEAARQPSEARKIQEQLRLLEQKKKRPIEQTQPQASRPPVDSEEQVLGGPACTWVGHQEQSGLRHTLQEYEAQLMLLKQQNKRRRIGVKMGKDTQSSRSCGASSSAEPPQEWIQQEEQVMINETAWISTGSRDLFKKPLVIRERPTCDD